MHSAAADVEVIKRDALFSGYYFLLLMLELLTTAAAAADV